MATATKHRFLGSARANFLEADLWPGMVSGWPSSGTLAKVPGNPTLCQRGHARP